MALLFLFFDKVIVVILADAMHLLPNATQLLRPRSYAVPCSGSDHELPSLLFSSNNAFGCGWAQRHIQHNLREHKTK